MSNALSGESDPAAYTERLYFELGRVANIKLPEGAINGILRHFPDWEFRAERTERTPIQILQRHIGHDALGLYTGPEIPRRKLSYDEDSFTITVDEVTGSDLQYLIEIEEQILHGKVAEPLAEPRILALKQQYANEVKEFSHHAKVDEALLRARQRIALSLLSHCDNNDEIAQVLDTSSPTISRVLSPARAQLGATDKSELMIICVALGVASIDHIPQGRTQEFKPGDKKLLAKFYSFDPAERAAFRARSSGRMDSRWSRLVTGHNITRREAILFAIKDELLLIPPKSALPQAGNVFLS